MTHRLQQMSARRRILCVVPPYSPSFGTFEHAYPLCGRRVRAFMPPQGILVVAAYLPSNWDVRFVDENLARVRDCELDWADAVFVSGMHIQCDKIQEINARAHSLNKVTVLGGPSVSADPERYPDFDYLHIGEIGDATDHLIEALDRDSNRPERQVILTTEKRMPLEAFPSPAYDLVEIDRYFLASIQFSSGCPFRCEFCDIPSLYGRVPRLKRPEQILAELDCMCAQVGLNAVYFVDDNFIGNKKAARELLPHLVEWQKRRGYPIQFACEATLNIAGESDILAMMREAYFCTLFCGIETPELDALRAMRKTQNARQPLLDAVATINSYGIEVVSGIILGLDTDTRETADRVLEFVRSSHIPILTINLLQALPRTPLWDRLKGEGRLIHDEYRESNVAFKLPYDDVVAMWRRCVEEAYRPETLYERFAYNVEHTYAHRLALPLTAARASPANIRRALRIAWNLLFRVGIGADYRETFWGLCWPLLKAGKIEQVIHVGLIAHHLISFARDALAGSQNASFYSARRRVPDMVGRAGTASIS